MKVRNICAPVFGATPIRKKSESKIFEKENSIHNQATRLPFLPTLVVISQLPQVNFSANHNLKDDLSKYDKFEGTPPELEIKKYNISKDVQRYIENEDYLSAIKGKLRLAEICRSQKKNEDTFYLEDSIKRLYTELPKYQKNEAKDLIRIYNNNMANDIDEDVEIDFDEV